MAVLRFTVPGQPVAKGRARSAVRGGRVVHYTPVKTMDYERRVRLAAQDAMEVLGRDVLIAGAVSVRLVATFEIPASWSKAKRSAADMHTIKPDLDNVVKAVFDGCNNAVWLDDCQVCALDASKGYGTVPGVEVVVEWLDQ